MPRFKVLETRGQKVEYLIEAESADAAGKLRGDILEEWMNDDYAISLDSVEEVEDEE